MDRLPQGRLLVACARFVAAAAAQQSLDEDRREQVAGTDEQAARSLGVAAEMIDARNRLYALLIDEGWTPPQWVVAGMALDEVVAQEGVGLRQG